MSDIIWNEWCYPHEGRDNIRQPWSRGDFSYATNGHVLIRTGRTDFAENLKAPDTGRVIGAIDFDASPVLLADLNLPFLQDEILRRSVSFGRPNTPFDLRYIHMIAALDGARLFVSPNPRGPSGFAFAGGIGAIMPLSRPCATHTEITPAPRKATA